jgi:hypothetical protein
MDQSDAETESMLEPEPEAQTSRGRLARRLKVTWGAIKDWSDK